MQASSVVPQTQRSIERDRIAAVERLIRPYVRHTPTITVDAQDFGLDAALLVMKLEFLQHIGSFKLRGAFANLLTRPAPPAGVAAASGGNHGAAVAYAAMRLGIRATIFVPHVTSPAKIGGLPILAHRNIRHVRALRGLSDRQRQAKDRAAGLVRRCR